MIGHNNVGTCALRIHSLFCGEGPLVLGLLPTGRQAIRQPVDGGNIFSTQMFLSGLVTPDIVKYKSFVSFNKSNLMYL